MSTAATSKGDRLVSLWLLVLCGMVFGIVAGGGHARTIGAGYIIQVWHPVTGFIPPRSPAGLVKTLRFVSTDRPISHHASGDDLGAVQSVVLADVSGPVVGPDHGAGIDNSACAVLASGKNFEPPRALAHRDFSLQAARRRRSAGTWCKPACGPAY